MAFRSITIAVAVLFPSYFVVRRIGNRRSSLFVRGLFSFRVMTMASIFPAGCEFYQGSTTVRAGAFQLRYWSNFDVLFC